MYLNTQLLFLLSSFYFTNAIQQLQKSIASVSSTDLVEDCSDDSYILRIDDLTLTPSFPEAGKPLDITVKGYAKDEILEGSEARLVLKLGTVRIIDKSIDVCDEVFNGTVECPVAPGPIEFVKTIDIPEHIPKGDFRLQFDAINDNESDLTCLRGHFDFRPK